jgi:hypothetical protein
MRWTKCFTITYNIYVSRVAWTTACEPIMHWSLLWCNAPTQIMIVKSLQDVFVNANLNLNFLQQAYYNLGIYVLITNGILAWFKEKPP